MTKKFLEQIQKRIVSLLKSQSNDPLYILSRDNCSEMSRLVAFWILERCPNVEITILKGKNVFGIKKRSHDILMIEDKNIFYLIDPTVWQFLKYKRNILMITEKSNEDVLDFTRKIYKGKWKISEKIKKIDKKEMKENERIIRLNLAEI